MVWSIGGPASAVAEGGAGPGGAATLINSALVAAAAATGGCDAIGCDATGRDVIGCEATACGATGATAWRATGWLTGWLVTGWLVTACVVVGGGAAAALGAAGTEAGTPGAAPGAARLLFEPIEPTRTAPCVHTAPSAVAAAAPLLGASGREGAGAHVLVAAVRAPLGFACAKPHASQQRVHLLFAVQLAKRGGPLVP